MITRRELAVASVATLTTLAAVAWAQAPAAPAKPLIKSAVFELDKIELRLEAANVRRPHGDARHAGVPHFDGEPRRRHASAATAGR